MELHIEMCLKLCCFINKQMHINSSANKLIRYLGFPFKYQAYIIMLG